MIDFHCHLDLYPDPWQVVQEIEEARIYVLSVTTTPTAWSGTVALAKGHKRIRTALGLHPQLAHERVKELELFERLLPRTSYVGEIGLDGGPEHAAHFRAQAMVFERVLQLCSREGGRVMTIHTRRAVDETLERLEAVPSAGTPILHWFSGSAQQLRRAVALGCWFSVGPAMLRGEKGRALTSAMPRDRVLTETDGPFAGSPRKPLKPTDADQAVEQLAELWKIPLAEVRLQLLDNLRTLGKSQSQRNASEQALERVTQEAPGHDLKVLGV